MNEKIVRQSIVEYGKRLTKTGLVQGTWGNIAVRLDKENMLVTPSGLDYMQLTPEDIVKVNIKTLEYSGRRKPTSEKRLHSEIFRKHPKVGAVVHAHSVNCGVFAAAGAEVPAKTKEMKRLVGGAMKCASHALPSTKRLSRLALKALTDRNACLLQNHGIVCCGHDLEEAYKICEVVEEAAGSCLNLD
ncbi:MAG: class II aldolase/adducin family protein [Lachnospiraceae bacterium]